MDNLEVFGFLPDEQAAGYQIFDSHAHYDDKKFNGDREYIFDHLSDYGVRKVLGCGSNFKSSLKNIEYAEKWGFCYAAAGVHPHDAEHAGNPVDFPFAELLKHPKVVAVGEIGLDFHYDFSPRDVQKEWYAYQLAVAKEHELPAVIHSREATKDTYDILKESGHHNGVVHCFSGSKETARLALNMGFYIGLGGAVTFNNAVTPREIATLVPLDRLLIETDAPYMTPAPYRGKRCTSAHIPFTAKVIAEIRGMSVPELLSVTKENAERLFKIK